MRALGLIAAAGLCLAAGLAAPAFANMPVKAWEVGPINAPSSSGVSFCSMKNYYEDGHGLVVARDAEGSNSLAVTFEKKTLQAGGQYKVTVRAENVEREMVGLAGTPQVLIVQMGLDRDFYLALQKKHSLNLSMKGKEIDFSLDGTGDALEALAKCANDSATGKKFTPVMVATDAKPPLNNEDPVLAPDAVQVIPLYSPGKQAAEDTLREEVERLKLENRKLQAESRAASVVSVQAQDPDEVLAELESEAVQQPVIKVTKERAPKIVAKRDTFLEDILKKSNITAKKDGAGYSWNTSDLFGAAEERIPPADGGLEAAVNDYVGLVGARCKGDFAHNESSIARNVNGVETIEGEFACIDGENDAAAALLFVHREGKVAVISYEGSTEQMEDALSSRSTAISNLSR